MGIVSIVGNPRRGGRTTDVAEAVADRLADAAGGVGTTTIELADLGPSLLEWGAADVAAALDLVRGADALVVATPTYKASFTGLLKLFLDQIGAGELAGTLTVPVMLGGSPAHTLALDTQLRPVLVELGAAIPTAGIYVVDSAMEQLPETLDAWWATAERLVRLLLAGAPRA